MISEHENIKPSYEALEKQNIELREQVAALKATVTEIHIARKKYDFLVNHVPDIMYELDDEGILHFVSDTVRQYGYNPEELVGKSILDIVHPDDRFKAMYRLKERRTGERGTKDLELRLLTRENESKEFEIRSKEVDSYASFLFTTEGLYRENSQEKRNFLGTLGIARDISERKRAELALKDSERLLSTIFVSIQEGITVLDTDLNVILMNDVMRRWFGDTDGFEGRKCYACYRGKDEPCNNCPALRCLKSGKTESEISRGIIGSPIEWIETFSYPMRDQDTGKITGVVEFVRNITERINAERIIAKTKNELMVSEKKYRNLLENTNDITITYTADGTINFISPQIEKYGYTPEEVEGENILSFIIHEDRERAMADFMKTIETGIEFPAEYRIADKNGKHRWIEDFSKAYRNSAGEITELTGVLHDITERKRAELMSDQLIVELNKKIEEVRQLQGVIPICSHCKKIRDDEGYWEKVEKFIQDHSEAIFSHGICPDCLQEHYKIFVDDED